LIENETPILYYLGVLSKEEFETIYLKIINLDEQNYETTLLLRAFMDGKVSGKEIEQYNDWSLLEAENYESLRRILNGEDVDMVMDDAGLSQ